jgi:low temperature requirement protein LtrA
VVGFGARDTHLGAGVMAAVLLGLVVAASFWLAYFDFASSGVQRLLAERRGAERIALARDAYTYAHLPMVSGIVLFAFAMTPVAVAIPALVALALVAAVWLGLHAYELIHWREERARRRSRADVPDQAAETHA